MAFYTDRVDGFQIADPTYIGLPPAGTPPTFDVVKWFQYDEPVRAIDMYSGEEKEVSEGCIVVAVLTWNRKEDSFDFRSILMRWLEEKPTEAVVRMVLDFAEQKGKELAEQDELR